MQSLTKLDDSDLLNQVGKMARTYRSKKRTSKQKKPPILKSFALAFSTTVNGLHRAVSKTLGKDFSITLFLIAFLIIATSILHVFNISPLQQIKQYAVDNGYRIKAVTIEGRKELSQKKILSLLNIQANQSIFDLNLEETHAKLIKNPWIHSVILAKRLPNTVFVQIKERTPIARWQNKGRLSVVDSEGVILTTKRMKDFSKFPIVIGKDAPAHVPEIIKELKSSPTLYNRVTALTLVSDRRWNVQIDHKIEIKLPQNNIISAWKHLEKIEKENKVLNNTVVSIDLRLPDRLIIRENNRPPKSKSRKT